MKLFTISAAFMLLAFALSSTAMAQGYGGMAPLVPTGSSMPSVMSRITGQSQATAEQAARSSGIPYGYYGYPGYYYYPYRGYYHYYAPQPGYYYPYPYPGYYYRPDAGRYGAGPGGWCYCQPRRQVR